MVVLVSGWWGCVGAVADRLWVWSAVVVVVGAGFAGRVRAGCLLLGSWPAGGRQAGAGSVLSFLNASASACAQGHEAGRRRVAVRAWKARRAATWSNR